MTDKYFKIKTKIIKETFNDTRNIESILPNNHDMNFEEDIFITENGELICLEIQIKDFDEEELANYIELAENLYKLRKKHVSIYILCPNNINIRVKECDIKSEADFNIKLAYMQENPCKTILMKIKDKLDNNEEINADDLNALSMLPIMCDEKDRHYYRKESIRLLNEIEN